MITEILLATLVNIKSVAETVAGIGLVMGFFFLGIFKFVPENDWEEKQRQNCKNVSNLLLIIGCISLPFVVIPTMNDLWRVRIGLIKLELSSEENIQKAGDEIQRIGQRLECKYLGGCEKEKVEATGSAND